MSEKQPKYIVIEGSTREDIQTKINSFAEDGYKVHNYTYNEYSYPEEGICGHKYTALMYLSSSNLDNLEGFENADIGSTRQNVFENSGYRPIANYSKHMTWARPKDETA